MSAAIINKFMDMMGIGNQEEYDEEEMDLVEDEEMETESEEVYSKPKSRSRRSFAEIEKESPYGAKSVQTKVIPMNTAVSSSKTPFIDS